jgi:hypothetical protein
MRDINWGDVPAWVASLLTGGSLLLGFWILLRDRRNTDRAQIDRFAFWVEGGRPDRHTASILIHVRNSSNLPVKGIHILVAAVITYDYLTVQGRITAEKNYDVLGPGESDDWERLFTLIEQARSSGLTLEPDQTSIKYVAARPEDVRVQDNSGRIWTMGDNEVLRLAKAAPRSRTWPTARLRGGRTR